MAPMTTQQVVSWGDPKNFCVVSRAEVCGEELLLSLRTEGAEFSPEDAEVTAPGDARMRLCGRMPAGCSDPERHRERRQLASELSTEVTLAFDCPEALQCAEDVLFSYAPGYSCVSILDLILSSLVQPQSLPESSLEICEGLESKAAAPFRREAWPVSAKARSRADAPPELPSPSLDTSSASSSRPLRLLQSQQVPLELHARDAKQKTAGTSGKSASSGCLHASGPSHAAATTVTRASSEAFFDAVEAGHNRTTSLLDKRLQEIGRLRRAWEAGESRALAEALEACRDDAVLYGVLQRLESHGKSWPPRALARLLPLAQRLSQSSSEAHAVTAMRFATKAIEASWPEVSRALQNVATPKAVFDDCKAAVQSVSSFFQMVKNLSRSVRISRTNGPLVPVCKELKTSLEKAMSAVGRQRGVC